MYVCVCNRSFTREPLAVETENNHSKSRDGLDRGIGRANGPDNCSELRLGMFKGSLAGPWHLTWRVKFLTLYRRLGRAVDPRTLLGIGYTS